ncbi:MAG: acetylxylan esterase [Fimbriimonadaceae bacterium]
MNLLEPWVPVGFDEFWKETLGEAESATLDWHLAESDRKSPTGHRVRVVQFRGVSGERREGWLATDRDEPGPGFLWVPPYGRWSMPPNEYGTRRGYVSLSLNFFGESAFHEENYTPERGYFAEGATDARDWVFRRMFQDSVIGLRILAEQAEADADRLGAVGLSQGGGIAIWLGAWSPLIRAVCADFPFLSAMRWVLSRKIHRYPLKELTDLMEQGNEDAVMRTLAFFDTVNQATRCEVPTLVVAGLKDPAVKTEQVEATFDALAGPKEIDRIDFGHDWHPSMVARNQTWLDRWL